MMKRAFIALTLIFLYSCESNKPEIGATANVEYRPRNNRKVSLEMVTVTMTDNRQTWQFTASDFSESSYGTWITDTVETDNKGDLVFDVSIIASDGTIISSGTALIPLSDDWAWGIDLAFGTENPSNCMGCFGGVALSLHSDFIDTMFFADTFLVFDSLYVVWGGNSITHPVDY